MSTDDKAAALMRFIMDKVEKDEIDPNVLRRSIVGLAVGMIIGSKIKYDEFQKKLNAEMRIHYNEMKKALS